MNKARTAAAGAKWTVACQLFVSAAQFAISGVTSRIFLPADFGGFAAAVSLMAILTLLTTTGLPSYVLKEATLSSGQVRGLRLVAVSIGVMTGIVFVLIAPLWLELLQAPEGGQYILSITIAQLLGPIGGVESALLRREIEPKRDTATVLISFVASAGLGLLGAVMIREAWVLGIPLAVAPLVLAISAFCFQRHSYYPGEKLNGRVLFNYARRITAQNVGFMLLQQTPGWAVVTTMGAGALGHFSKGVALAQMPATALTSIQSRIAQPHWRNAGGCASFQRAVCDAALLSAGAAFPAFAILSINGSEVVNLWLGPGWELAGTMTSTLAIGFAFSIPFTLMAGSLEMRGDFRPARVAQWCMAMAMVPPVTAMIVTQDVIWASRTLAISQAAALVCIISAVRWRNARVIRRLVQGLLTQAAWSTAVGFSGLLARELLPPLSSDFFQLVVAATVSIIVWIVTFRWHVSSSVLVRRGFKLPWLFRPLAA